MSVMADSAVVLITGASQGIGAACARRLGERGYRVYGGSRSFTGSNPGPASRHAEGFQTLPLDVTHPGSVSSFVNQVFEREGRIDVLINNAGFGIAGAVEDTSIGEFMDQFETNFFGTIRMCQQVLPLMRKQGEGMILNVSSLAGKVAVPFQSAYSASKFALEGLSDSLRMEVQPFGIKVVLIQPGDLATEFTDNRRRSEAMAADSPYHRQFKAALTVMEQDERNGAPPEKVAELVWKILQERNPRLRYQVGPWFQKAAVAAKRFLPEKSFEAGLSRYYQVHT